MNRRSSSGHRPGRRTSSPSRADKPTRNKPSPRSDKDSPRGERPFRKSGGPGSTRNKSDRAGSSARGGQFDKADRRPSDHSAKTPYGRPSKPDRARKDGPSQAGYTKRSYRKPDSEGSGYKSTPGSDKGKRRDERRPFVKNSGDFTPRKFDRRENSDDTDKRNTRGRDERRPFVKNTSGDFTPRKFDRRENSDDTDKRNARGRDTRRDAKQRYDDNKRPSSPRKRTGDAYQKPEGNRPRKSLKAAGDKTMGDSPLGLDDKRRNEKQHSPAEPGKIRLNKFIANSGVCSRREADELIKMGLISVNGKTITELGYKVNPSDEIRHESKVLRAEKPVYILLNKPKGFLTTTADPQERNTVMHLIANFVKERVYPVGRLDRNTTGLLLLTNDGDLAEKLMHPSYNVKKIYKVELDRPLTKADAQRVLEGIKLDEGRTVVDELAILSDDRKTIGLEIHIGWNRVVRRIFESLEYQVVKLDRTAYAGLTKKDIGRGEWRFLKKEELVLLKHYK